jgi:hypothetical protein
MQVQSATIRALNATSDGISGVKSHNLLVESCILVTERLKKEGKTVIFSLFFMARLPLSA